MAEYLVNGAGLSLRSGGVGQLSVPSFTRYGSNPVIALGAGGTWEDVDIANPDVKWDAISGQWVMNYSGFDGSDWHTGIAYSSDLLSWSKEANNPVLSPTGAEGYIAANGSIISIGSNYYLYYQGGTASARIYCAASSDLVNWTRQNGGSPVIDVGAGGQWDDTQVFDPYARTWIDGTVELFYSGDDGAGERAIGHATSADGITFTKQGKLLDSIVGDIDANFGEPGVIGSETAYAIYHDSSRFVGYRYISRAITVDSGSNFTYDWAVLQHGAAGQWDDAQVFDPSPIYYNNTLYLFYAGADTTGSAENLNAQIGLARAALSTRKLTN